MKVINGDLIQLALEGKFDVIIHGCNCHKNMGKGIAKTIKQVFPEAIMADKNSSLTTFERLGNYSLGRHRGPNGDIFIVNAYTQFDYNRYGNKKQQADYEAIEKVFKRIKKRFHGLRIGYPKLGAGLGGANWEIISKIIDRELQSEDHTLVVLD